jgi:hypothetical protein
MNIVNIIKNNKALIFTGLGIAATALAIYKEYKTAPKVVEAMKQAEQEKGAPLTKKERMKVQVKTQWPVIAIGMSSAALTAAAHWVNKQIINSQASKLVEKTALLSAANAKISKYQDKVLEKFGTEAEKEIHDAVMSDEVKKVTEPAILNGNVYVTGRGTHHFQEEETGVIFDSSIDDVKKGIRALNARLMSVSDGGDSTLDDLLDNWGVGGKHGNFASDYGWMLTSAQSVNCQDWSEDEDFIEWGGPITPRLSSTLLDNGEPVTVIGWYIRPIDLTQGVS